MKGYEALKLLREAAEYSNTSFGEISLQETISIYDCSVIELDDKLMFLIGTRELVKDPEKMFDNADVMHPLVGLFHEVCGHGGQQHYEFQKDTSLSKVLALNHYACHASWNYYGFRDGKIDEQYFKQPHEIAAQYTGIYCAYQFLCREYSSKDASNMICDYVNERIELKSEFGLSDKKYTSVETILDDMNKAFRQSVFQHREYEHSKRNPDMLVQLARRQKNPDIVTRVERCGNGLRQDFMMAAVYPKAVDKTHTIQNQPACKAIAFQSAFHVLSQPIRPKPRASDLNLSDLTNVQHPELTLTANDLAFANEWKNQNIL